MKSAIGRIIITACIASLMLTGCSGSKVPLKKRLKAMIWGTEESFVDSSEESEDYSETEYETEEEEEIRESKKEKKEKKDKEDKEDSEKSGGPGKKSGDSLFKGELDEDLKGISTTEPAYATEFDWFYGWLHPEDGYETPQIEDSRKIRADEAERLNGGWKCYMCALDEKGLTEEERYMHVDIDTDGDDMNLTLVWGWYFPPYDASNGDNSSIDESSEKSETVSGSWQKGDGIRLGSDIGIVDIDCFYELDQDNGVGQYAIGSFTFNSGEEYNFALMRDNFKGRGPAQ